MSERLTSERLKDDDIQASRLEETRVRERTLENRRGRGDRSEGGEESLKSAGLLLFRNTFFPSGKMVGAVWGKRCASGDKLCGKAHKKCDARRHRSMVAA